MYNLRCKVLGKEHPDTLLSLGNLAAAYGHLGDFQKELELEEKVYQLKCKKLGDEHTDTLLTLSNIAMTYRNLGNYEKAVEVGERAYNLRCKVLGEEHPDTLLALNNLTYAYIDLEKLKIACKLIMRYIWIIFKRWVKEKYLKIKRLILRKNNNSNNL